MEFTLDEIARILNVPCNGDGTAVVRGVSTDSRTIEDGVLFFALRGERFNGHGFVNEALAKGACGAVVERRENASAGKNLEGILLAVEDPLRALQDVASAYRRIFKIPVLAVTGTNGKTTTKEMASSVLSAKYKTMKSKGNLNNHIGVPLAVCLWEKDAQAAVVEMGTNHFGEIRRLCEIAQPTHGLITNVGKGHLEYFNDADGVAHAKAELLDFLQTGGNAFLNGDDPRLWRLKDVVPHTVTYGFSERCDFTGEDAGLDEEGFPVMRVEGKKLRIRIHGRYNLYNVLAAAAVGRAFGVDWEAIQEAFEIYRPMEKRMEVLRFRGIVVLNDTYNANPSSVRCALDTLHDLKDVKRKIAVLGDMLELGEKSDEEHRRVGEWVVTLGLDGFFGYGKGMQLAVERARNEGLKDASYHESKEDLLNAIKNVMVQGDAILVKGSRGMRMEEIVEGLKGNRRRETGGRRPASPPPATE